MLRIAALVLMLLLVGCVGDGGNGDDAGPSPTPAGATPSPAQGTPSPSPGPATPTPSPTPDPTPEDTGAPRWTVGESWNYTILDGAGTASGYVRYLVRGPATSPEGRVEYEVQIDEVRWNATPRRSVEWFDALTFHQRWDACGAPGAMPDCRGVHAWLDFPFAENKTWTVRGDRGDVPVLYNGTARSAGGGAWNLTFVPAACGDACGQARIEMAYDPEVRFLRERVQYGEHGWVVERWTLAAHQGFPVMRS